MTLAPEPDPTNVLDLHHELREVERRIQALAAELDQINATMPPQAQIGMPPHLEVTCAVNALTAMLIEAGVVDELAFRVRKGAKVVEAFEQIVGQAREIRRQVQTGLVIAQPGVPPDAMPPNGGMRPKR